MANATIRSKRQTSFTNRIHHSDCIEVMRQIPSNSVDFILTDPPVPRELP